MNLLPGVPPVLFDSEHYETERGGLAMKVTRKVVRWHVQPMVPEWAQSDLQNLSDDDWTIYSVSDRGIIAYRHEEEPSE